MSRPNPAALALALALAAGPAARVGAEVGSPWVLGFRFAAEGFGEGPLGGQAGAAPGELLRAGLVFDPVRWPILVPSLEAFASLPVFPWALDRAQIGAALDIRLFQRRSPLLERATREPLLYAPSLAISYRYRPADGQALACLGIRPLEVRMGDGVYSILAVQLAFDAEPSLAPRGYMVELVSFTHFYW